MIFKSLGGLVLAFCVISSAMAAGAPDVNPDQAIYVENQRALLNSLQPKFGDVAVPGAEASLQLGKAYYFLGAKDAKRVLIEGWNNPEGQTDDVLGMIFPAGKTYLDDGWGAVVTFVPEGHVTEAEFSPKDFDRVAQALRDAEGEINEARKKENVAPVHFVGWATTPAYDASRHTAVWAREFQFGDEPSHGLNYDVRSLGRRGSLSLNMVSTMDHLPEIQKAADALQQTAAFNPGARYEDFDPKVDKAAGYGVAGMVAAGAGVLLAKKLGLIAILLLFAKKGLVVAIAAAAWAGNWLRGRLGLKKKQAALAQPRALTLDDPEPAEPEAPVGAVPPAEAAAEREPADAP